MAASMGTGPFSRLRALTAGFYLARFSPGAWLSCPFGL